MTIKRTTAAGLSLSAVAFAALVTSEGWMGTADVPVKGDRCTNGFGSTFREDGSPVKCGEKIEPPQAVKRSLSHIQQDEKGIKQCVTAELSQGEYDLMVDFAYQYGVKTLCASSIAKEANAGNYQRSCEGYKKYRFVAGFDCSTPGNKQCPGVWKRSLERFDRCMKEQ